MIASAALAQGKQMLTQFSSSWVSFRDYDGKTLLYITHFLTQRGALKTIRYSLDGDALDKTFPFDPPSPARNPTPSAIISTSKSPPPPRASPSG